MPIDPKDVGRSYEGVIRINSQSGKGGAAFILEKEWGFRIPKAMQPSVGSAVQKMTEEKGRELTSEEVRGCFGRGFLAVKGKYELKEYSESTGNESSVVKAVINDESSDISIEAEGNGPVAAFVHGLNRHFSTPVEIVMYEEHALSAGADAEAAAYIGLKQGDVKAFGAGVDANISRASVKAVMNALNNL